MSFKRKNSAIEVLNDSLAVFHFCFFSFSTIKLSKVLKIIYSWLRKQETIPERYNCPIFNSTSLTLATNKKLSINFLTELFSAF